MRNYRLKNINAHLRHLQKINFAHRVDMVGEAGVNALREATPIDTGVTSHSWYYIVEDNDPYWSIKWFNSEMAGMIPLVIILDSGHVTGTGGWVPGYNFIGPAMEPEFQKFRSAVVKEIK